MYGGRPSTSTGADGLQLVFAYNWSAMIGVGICLLLLLAWAQNRPEPEDENA